MRPRPGGYVQETVFREVSMWQKSIHTDSQKFKMQDVFGVMAQMLLYGHPININRITLRHTCFMLHTR